LTRFSPVGLRLRFPVTSALTVLFSLLGTDRTIVDRSAAVAVGSPAEVWGVYVGAGAKNVTGAPAFAARTGLAITGVVDFPGEATWADITGPSWLLNPYRDSGLVLEYSLPLLPDGVGPDGAPWTLDACANGSYDFRWATLGKNLVVAHLPATVVRPGWEFNGSWYRWGAAGKVASFVGCFRHVVTAMRAVAGSNFTFDWNPGLGLNAFPAEQAYPGAAYVDVIGVDIYDTSWTAYPPASGVTAEAAQTSAWNWLLKGNHGLSFWSTFARDHSKPMSITEWGVTWLPDGHGGGDDPAFVDRMLDFIADPLNNIVANHYFNADAPTVRHNLTRPDTYFPASLARLEARAG
jgi:hypothetical protein